jgi:hypothetical protein
MSPTAGAGDLELCVVPPWTRAIVTIKLDWLRIPEVPWIVSSPVAEVDTAHESDVGRRSIFGISAPMTNDDELLVMTACAPHTLVEQHLAARPIDNFGELAVLPFAEMHLVEVGAPNQSPHVHSSTRGAREHSTDLRARTVESGTSRRWCSS